MDCGGKSDATPAQSMTFPMLPTIDPLRVAILNRLPAKGASVDPEDSAASYGFSKIISLRE